MKKEKIKFFKLLIQYKIKHFISIEIANLFN